MVKIIIALLILAIPTGCAIKPKPFTPPPSVAVSKLDNSLSSIDMSNQKAASYIDKSLNLADRIDILLQQAENERNK